MEADWTEGASSHEPAEPTGPQSVPTSERRRRERAVWRRAFGVSVVLHVLLFLTWTSTSVPRSPFAAEGTRSGDPNPAEGAMEAVSMRPVVPEPVTAPVVPVPEVDVDEVPEMDESPELELASLEDPSPGEADREGEEAGDGPAGREDGTGEGDAGSGGEGVRRLVPPSPRGMIIPPSNENLRGTSFEVWVFVDASGQVVPDSTRLNPPTRDEGFNERIQREAAEWVFEPARRDGEPVAAWFPYTITM